MEKWTILRLKSLVLLFLALACHKVYANSPPTSQNEGPFSLRSGVLPAKPRNLTPSRAYTNSSCVIEEFMGTVGEFYGTEEFDRMIANQALGTLLVDQGIRGRLADFLWENRQTVTGAMTFDEISDSKIAAFEEKVKERCDSSSAEYSESEDYDGKRQSDSTEERDCSFTTVDAACFIAQYSDFVGRLYTANFLQATSQNFVNRLGGTLPILNGIARGLCTTSTGVLSAFGAQPDQIDSFFDAAFARCSLLL